MSVNSNRSKTHTRIEVPDVRTVARYLLESLVRTPVEILVAALMLALVLGIAGPAILQMHERAKKNQVTHRMQNMGLGLSGYHDTFGSFPVSPPAQQRSATPKAKAPAELISPLVVMPLGMH